MFSGATANIVYRHIPRMRAPMSTLGPWFAACRGAAKQSVRTVRATSEARSWIRAHDDNPDWINSREFFGRGIVPRKPHTEPRGRYAYRQRRQSRASDLQMVWAITRPRTASAPQNMPATLSIGPIGQWHLVSSISIRLQGCMASRSLGGSSGRRAAAPAACSDRRRAIW